MQEIDPDVAEAYELGFEQMGVAMPGKNGKKGKPNMLVQLHSYSLDEDDTTVPVEKEEVPKPKKKAPLTFKEISEELKAKKLANEDLPQKTKDSLAKLHDEKMADYVESLKPPQKFIIPKPEIELPNPVRDENRDPDTNPVEAAGIDKEKADKLQEEADQKNVDGILKKL